MARIDTLGHFLTDIADAIRTKTGNSETIAAEDFDTEIKNIPSGGESIPDVYNEADMDALLNDTNYGKKFNYVGEVEKYLNCIYEVDRNLIDDGTFFNDSYFCPTGSATSGSSTIKCSIGSKLIAFITLRNATYTLSEGWNVLGVSEQRADGTIMQYMIVATKTATSKSETLTVTQGANARMYINIIEVTSKATVVLEGFTYGEKQKIYIQATNQSGIKIYGLSTGYWNTTVPYKPWACQPNTLKYSGLDVNSAAQQRQGLFYGKIDTPTTFNFSPPDVSADNSEMHILAIISLTGFTPTPNYKYYFTFYNTKDIITEDGFLKNAITIDGSNTNILNQQQLYRFYPNIESIQNLINVSKGSFCYNSKQLRYIGEVTFNISKTTDYRSSFQQCTSLERIDKMDTSEITKINQFFATCSNLESIPEIDVSSIDGDMLSMFDGCFALKEIKFISNSQKVLTTIESAFRYCKVLEKIDARVFDFTNVTSSSNTFYQVPTNCEIIVADQTQKDWFATNFPDLTNVKTVEEYEAV